MSLRKATFRRESARDFSVRGKIAASLLFCENEVLKKPSRFAQKSQRFPGGTSPCAPPSRSNALERNF
jgi:hypothetical protein